MPGKLVQGENIGGPRHFLDGKEVHCGQSLEMKTPQGWVEVRYEASLYPGGVQVYLYANPWLRSRPHAAELGKWCEQCEAKVYSTSEPCPEPDWGPEVIVGSRPDDFKRIPSVELRWPDPKRSDRSLFDRD